MSHISPSHIIVVGASTGGVEALKILAAGFPADLAAAVLVVLHIGKGISGKSFLPDLLNRAGPLEALNAVDGATIQHGKIYVAPPDRHLMVEVGHIHLSHGPKENHTRPSINPLFRSAAAAYKSSVTGVILTGMLDDGVAGLAEIKRKGGLAVVQDPNTALFPSMPMAALEFVDVDFIVPLSDMASVLSKVAVLPRNTPEIEEPVDKIFSSLTCLECQGPLWLERQGRIVEYRCRIGHAYSPLSLKEGHKDKVERALWSAVVALEEADIAEQIKPVTDKIAEETKQRRACAELLKQMLEKVPL